MGNPEPEIASHNLRQIRTPRAALIIKILRLLSWAIRRDLVRPVEQLGVNPVSLDQPMEVIPTSAAALFALDVEHFELAD